MKKKKIAVIGAGISGLSMAQLLNEAAEVTVYERAEKAGGLVKCTRTNGNLFHRVGGHVFNSKNKEVLNWFWSRFDQATEFIKANRNAKILLNGKIIGYPLENYLHQLPAETVSAILDDMLAIGQNQQKPEDFPHFEAFLQGNFGKTLYELYFRPYNTKIWNLDLSTVPLGWLEGKLPMPNLKQMLMSNIVKQEESEMVHATFYYPKNNGSQFIIDRLAEGINLKTNAYISQFKYDGQTWDLGTGEAFDAVVFSGDIRQMQNMVFGLPPAAAESLKGLENLRANGTSNLLCECDATDVSWLYLPGAEVKAHRIIYTGNFAESNNSTSEGRISCTVEFSGKHSFEEMAAQLPLLPGNMKAIDWNYEPNSYVVQDEDTRARILNAQETCGALGLHFLGRFGEWEYYNMDKAIEAAMALKERVL